MTSGMGTLGALGRVLNEGDDLISHFAPLGRA